MEINSEKIDMIVRYVGLMLGTWILLIPIVLCGIGLVVVASLGGPTGKVGVIFNILILIFIIPCYGGIAIGSVVRSHCGGFEGWISGISYIAFLLYYCYYLSLVDIKPCKTKLILKVIIMVGVLLLMVLGCIEGGFIEGIEYQINQLNK